MCDLGKHFPNFNFGDLWMPDWPVWIDCVGAASVNVDFTCWTLFSFFSIPLTFLLETCFMCATRYPMVVNISMVKVVIFEHCAPHRCLFDPDNDFRVFHVRGYPASLRNAGGSTQMPVQALNNARKGTWDFPPPVKLECAIWPTLWRCHVKPNNSNKQTSNKLTNFSEFIQFYCIKYYRNTKNIHWNSMWGISHINHSSFSNLPLLTDLPLNIF
jgi:hypothetical protein